MNPSRHRGRRSLRYQPSSDRLEDRRLLSRSSMISALQVDPVALPAVHPNTPVMPFATPTKKASFLDPTVKIENGNSVLITFRSSCVLASEQLGV